ncbi:hypothetical protein [Streptomyces sp. R44]|uniref:Septum formation-related domain-containing protein n=1 Tax=Streptomyces sp. R44 TaxID=3238633 RepID=A0AB39T8Q5_9ACTN
MNATGPNAPGPISPGPNATGPTSPGPNVPSRVEGRITDPRVTEGLGSGAEAGWPARFVRLGAPRPGPAARRARWFGVPLVPLLTAALVAGAFLTARGGAEGGGLADGRPGGDPVGVPSPVLTDGTGSPAPAPTTGGTTADTPTRTAPQDRAEHPQAGTSAAPSRSGTTGPTPTATAPTPSGRPTEERPVSFDMLRVGDCFDIDRDAPGTALRRGCDTPHQAELVARLRLVGTFATDQDVREAATALCREPLRRKAARQPLGTRWTTFAQYPYLTGHLLGADTVACSLAVTSGTLSHRLQ